MELQVIARCVDFPIRTPRVNAVFAAISLNKMLAIELIENISNLYKENKYGCWEFLQSECQLISQHYLKLDF